MSAILNPYLMFYPVVLGEGKKLFQDAVKTDLKLVDSKTFKSGIVLLTHQPTK